MNTTNLPYGAREIIALRAIGKRPADMVLVSLVGPLREANPVVVARPSWAYDWRFLVGLPVLVIVSTQTEDIAGTVRAIEAAAPATLVVWFADRQDGINVLIEEYHPRTKHGRRMDIWQRDNYAGLGVSIPPETCRQRIAEEVRNRIMLNAHHLDADLLQMASAGFRHIFGNSLEAAACA